MTDPKREPVDENQLPEDVMAYLAKIRDTIKRSEALIETAELRIAETDRFLEQQGLSRDDVKKLLDNHPLTPEQQKQLDAELARLGIELPAFQEQSTEDSRQAHEEGQHEQSPGERSRKLRNLMNPYRL